MPKGPAGSTTDGAWATVSGRWSVRRVGDGGGCALEWRRPAAQAAGYVNQGRLRGLSQGRQSAQAGFVLVARPLTGGAISLARVDGPGAGR